jgi:hypothetical protein
MNLAHRFTPHKTDDTYHVFDTVQKRHAAGFGAFPYPSADTCQDRCDQMNGWYPPVTKRLKREVKKTGR